MQVRQWGKVPLLDRPLRVLPRLDRHLLRHAVLSQQVRPQVQGGLQLQERRELPPHHRPVQVSEWVQGPILRDSVRAWALRHQLRLQVPVRAWKCRRLSPCHRRVHLQGGMERSQVRVPLRAWSLRSPLPPAVRLRSGQLLRTANRSMHLQEWLFGPQVRPSLPEGPLWRQLQTGVPSVHLRIRHVRLPDRAVRVQAGLHWLLLLRAVRPWHLRQEVPGQVRLQEQWGVPPRERGVPLPWRLDGERL